MTTAQMTWIAAHSHYRVFAQFVGSDGKAATEPYLIPPQTRIDADIALAPIEYLFRRPPQGDPKPMKDNSNRHFTFAWAAQDLKAVPPKNADKVQAKVTIKQNVWNAAPAERQALRESFLAFCAQLEAYELSGDGLIEGGAAIIANLIAESLPLPLSETLLYHTGFNLGLGGPGTPYVSDFNRSGKPYVDLRPGMRLRVDFAANQFIAPGSPLNGLVGAGQASFTVWRDSSQQLVLDPFLDAISAPTVEAALSQATASGVLDFHGARAARRHYRLIYPTAKQVATQPGDVRLRNNVTLIGADTLADLQSATSSFIDNDTVESDTASKQLDGAAASVKQLPVAFAFRGRAVVVPEIGVYVRRQSSSYMHETAPFVPLGTTLRQLLDQYAGTWNPGRLSGSNALKLLRFWSEENGLSEYHQVDLNGSPLPDPRVFDLPLVHGDRIELNFVQSSN